MPKLKTPSDLLSALPSLSAPHSAQSVMRRVVARAKAPGLSPGSLVHTGEQVASAVRITRMVYDPQTLEEEVFTTGEHELAFDPDDARVTWMNVDGLHDTALIQSLGELFGVHPLALEDALHVGQRPKADEYDSSLYVVMHMLRYDASQEVITREQISLFLGKNFVLTLQEHEGDVFEPVRQRVRLAAKGRIRERGPDYLLYALMDAIVDEYYVVLEKLGDRLEQLDEEVMVRPKPHTLQDIHELKRELIVIRRAAWPVRELVSQLLRSERDFITQDTRMYLRDVYDHAVQSMDTIETLRDLAAGLADLYLTSLGQRTNDVMKVLTVMSSIFIPLTFVAGIYGMNFENMPELKTSWGYPAVWALMLSMAGGMLLYFRRKNWF